MKIGITYELKEKLVDIGISLVVLLFIELLGQVIFSIFSSFFDEIGLNFSLFSLARIILSLFMGAFGFIVLALIFQFTLFIKNNIYIEKD